MTDERTTEDRRRLRSTFERVAEQYDRARPLYPAAVFDELGQIAGLGPGSRVLEIGPGTGQATRGLLEHGYAVRAVELGPDLAAITRRNLAGSGGLELVVGDFEEQPPSDQPFDAVVTAAAFHWLDPETRLARIAAHLRPGGWLAVLDRDHVAGGTAAFFEDAQDCYLRFDPSTEPDFHLPEPEAVERPSSELLGAGFDGAQVRRHLNDLSHDARAFVDLVGTYSPVLDLAAERRAGLLACLGDLAERRYAGQVVMRYLTTLRMARLASPGA